MSLRDRLYSRLVPDPETGCLLWTGYVDESGYGVIRIDKTKTQRVHRAAWELEHGPVPTGLQLDHVKARGCRHRNCANVAHLEPVTQRENIMRGNGIAPRRAAQTECVNGHPLAGDNVIPDGRNRRCRECRRNRGREFARRKRAEVKAVA